jgi:hypothetical protein
MQVFIAYNSGEKALTCVYNCENLLARWFYDRIHCSMLELIMTSMSPLL